jgi:hypothetical protein
MRLRGGTGLDWSRADDQHGTTAGAVNDCHGQCGLVAICGVMGWQVSREREPAYEGKPQAGATLPGMNTAQAADSITLLAERPDGNYYTGNQ